jgi:hypothetical protein
MSHASIASPFKLSPTRSTGDALPDETVAVCSDQDQAHVEATDPQSLREHYGGVVTWKLHDVIHWREGDAGLRVVSMGAEATAGP